MIAVVDDEESVRKAVVRVLQAAGFAARAFASGTEFLESWHFDRPDCLVLDLQMPGLSGTEVQRSLRTAGREFSDRHHHRARLAESARGVHECRRRRVSVQAARYSSPGERRIAGYASDSIARCLCSAAKLRPTALHRAPQFVDERDRQRHSDLPGSAGRRSCLEVPNECLREPGWQGRSQQRCYGSDQPRLMLSAIAASFTTTPYINGFASPSVRDPSGRPVTSGVTTRSFASRNP